MESPAVGPPSSPPPRLVRKRTRASELSESYPSSDPAFFSSDDTQDEGAENYQFQRPRKKVQWRGTWWGRGGVEGGEESVARRTRSASKQNFTRNFDSGIFMGSDTSDTTLPDSCDFALPKPPQPKRMNPLVQEIDETLEVVQEFAIGARICQAVDTGGEVVDLTDLNLKVLPGPPLLPLRAVVRPANHLDGAGSSSPRSYSALTANIQLFLGNNRLSRLPGELLQLDNLAVLSLRNNELVELPSRIGELTGLRELNLSNNKLRYLPESILNFWETPGKSPIRVNLSSNPLMKAFPVEGVTGDMQSSFLFKAIFSDDIQSPFYRAVAGPQLSHNQLRAIFGSNNIPPTTSIPPPPGWTDMINFIRPRVKGWMPRYFTQAVPVAETPVAYLTVDGSVIGGGTPPSKMFDARIQRLIYEGESTPPVETSSSTAPSLFETALRRFGTSISLANAAGDEFSDVPPPVRLGLDSAFLARDEGGRVCAKCGKLYVIPRTEWIEFVRIMCDSDNIQMDKLYLPILRRGCSLSCGKEPAPTSRPIPRFRGQN